jgi:site-specific recombinase XerD
MLMPISKKNILAAFEEYMNAAPLPSRTREGAAEKTIKGYVYDVNDFLQWWKQSEGEELSIDFLRKDPFSLNKKTIQDYVNYQERSMAIATLLRKVSSLRAFVIFLQVSKVIEHEPMNGLRLPRKAEPEPRGLTDNQRARFEAAFQNPWIDKTTKRKRSKEIEENVLKDARNHLIRDKAIAFLIMYAGPRVEELFQLNVADIELREKSGSLHIRKGKGFKERRTSIPLPARRALRAWLTQYQELDSAFSKDSPLFIRLRGRPGGRLSIRALQNMISEAGKRARIKESVTPHILRHTCAFMLRQAGVDIETRAKMLGHSIETAAKYGAPGENEIEKAAALLDYAEAA